MRYSFQELMKLDTETICDLIDADALEGEASHDAYDVLCLREADKAYELALISGEAFERLMGGAI